MVLSIRKILIMSRNIFYLVIIGNAVLSGTQIESGRYTTLLFIADMILLFLFFADINIKRDEQD